MRRTLGTLVAGVGVTGVLVAGGTSAAADPVAAPTDPPVTAVDVDGDGFVDEVFTSPTDDPDLIDVRVVTALGAAERVHLIGLVSGGGVHSSEEHLKALIRLAAERNVPDLVIHAFTDGRGVCQDFSHIMIGALRSLSIPAGYVSGLIRTIPPKGRPRLEGADAMHAWVMAWCGAEAGWVELDPTNDVLAGQDHILVARGRDYADVAPVKGIMRIAGAQRGGHSVDVIPLDGS